MSLKKRSTSEVCHDGRAGVDAPVVDRVPPVLDPDPLRFQPMMEEECTRTRLTFRPHSRLRSRCQSRTLLRLGRWMPPSLQYRRPSSRPYRYRSCSHHPLHVTLFAHPVVTAVRRKPTRKACLMTMCEVYHQTMMWIGRGTLHRDLERMRRCVGGRGRDRG